MIKLVSGPLDKLCPHCPGGATRMRQLPMTKTWICPICSSTDWHIPKEAQNEQWMAEED